MNWKDGVFEAFRTGGVCFLPKEVQGLLLLKGFADIV